MPTFKQFKLPDAGEGLTEAEILKWYVQPGDHVTVNQVLVEIETAKAAVELPSPYAGTVTELLVTEGSTVDVGTPIITVDVDPDGAPGVPAARCRRSRLPSRRRPRTRSGTTWPRPSPGRADDEPVEPGHHRRSRARRADLGAGRLRAAVGGRQAAAPQGRVVRNGAALRPAARRRPRLPSRCRSRPSRSAASAPPAAGPAPQPGQLRPAGGPGQRLGAGQAAGPQAGQGPRRRPRRPDRLRAQTA